MSDTKWTPGPWEAMNEGWVAGPEDCENVAQALPWNFVGSQEIQTANAHLIAAAPDLYEALEHAKKMLEEYETEATGESFNSLMINAALAKARGETKETT